MTSIKRKKPPKPAGFQSEGVTSSTTPKKGKVGPTPPKTTPRVNAKRETTPTLEKMRARDRAQRGVGGPKKKKSGGGARAQ